MNTRLRKRIGVIALILALGLLLGWSHQRHSDGKDAAAAAQAALAETRELITEIEALKDRPVMAGAREMELTELTRLIEHAAEETGLAPDQLERIWPEAARRVADSDYREKPTQVLLRGVSLDALLGFLHTLTQRERSLSVSALRLVAPRETDGRDERWTVELTISYLIYDPLANVAG